ncbi:hypothetical protein [Candidatus Methylacidithermus pantelleriae]|uniref:hypothetical protein n=1 Tax=Candidatus Methylacidithermus pantelleriae TaxID=2744239 RepID=UPI00157BCB8C|nr:hypothetical protein [Candidatus Methylacidithermus pantelleriae]
MRQPFGLEGDLAGGRKSQFDVARVERQDCRDSSFLPTLSTDGSLSAALAGTERIGRLANSSGTERDFAFKLPFRVGPEGVAGIGKRQGADPFPW